MPDVDIYRDPLIDRDIVFHNFFFYNLYSSIVKDVHINHCYTTMDRDEFYKFLANFEKIHPYWKILTPITFSSNELNLIKDSLTSKPRDFLFLEASVVDSSVWNATITLFLAGEFPNVKYLRMVELK